MISVPNIIHQDMQKVSQGWSWPYTRTPMNVSTFDFFFKWLFLGREKWGSRTTGGNECREIQSPVPILRWHCSPYSHCSLNIRGLICWESHWETKNILANDSKDAAKLNLQRMIWRMRVMIHFTLGGLYHARSHD